MKHLPFLLVLLCALLPACALPPPPATKPPYSSITVNRPFSWGDGIITYRVNMPAGIYRYQLQDHDGYYYATPGKIRLYDKLFPRQVDAGLYLERNRTRPEKIYLIRGGPFGLPTKLRVGDRADLTLNP